MSSDESLTEMDSNEAESTTLPVSCTSLSSLLGPGLGTSISSEGMAMHGAGDVSVHVLNFVRPSTQDDQLSNCPGSEYGLPVSSDGEDFSLSDETSSTTSEATTDLPEDIDMNEVEDNSDFFTTESSGATKCISEEEYDPFSVPLYDGADISVFESYFLLFQFAVRHSLTMKSFSELLQVVKVHLPRSAKTPKSVHYLKKYFLSIFPHAKCNVHKYCTACLERLTDATTCSTNG